MDVRYFELHDLLCEALILLEAGRSEAAAAKIAKALRWAETDWLATHADLRAEPAQTLVTLDATDDDD